MTISVVIPTYNRKELVLRTLATLAEQEAVDEVIVVDDGSPDGTAEAVRALEVPCALRVIEQQNQGPAAARNTGWRAAQGELILFLDDDMLCAPGLVKAHLDAHDDALPTIAMGEIRLSADSPRTLAALCIEREFAAHARALKPAETGAWLNVPIIFSNTSLKRQLLDESGGFDEAFRMREDLELGYRLLQAGAKPKAVPGAIAHQLYTKSARDLLHDAEVFAEGDVLFAQKHPKNRVHGQLNWFDSMPHRKLELAATARWVVEPGLSAACALSETLPLARCLGVPALTAWRRLRWLRRVRECDITY